jgi:hypothetical protein
MKLLDSTQGVVEVLGGVPSLVLIVKPGPLYPIL